jgi:hypothetical protein
MRSSLVISLERLTANTPVATVLGSIPASVGTVESVGAADEAVLNTVRKKEKKSPKKIFEKKVLNHAAVLLCFANERRGC